MILTNILLSNSQIEFNSLPAINVHTPTEMVEGCKIALSLWIVGLSQHHKPIKGNCIVMFFYVLKSLKQVWRVKACHVCSSQRLHRKSCVSRLTFSSLSS